MKIPEQEKILNKIMHKKFKQLIVKISLPNNKERLLIYKNGFYDNYSDCIFSIVPTKYINQIILDNKLLFKENIKYNEIDMIKDYLDLSSVFIPEMIQGNKTNEIIKISFTYYPAETYNFLSELQKKNDELIINLLRNYTFKNEIELIYFLNILDSSLFENKNFLINFIDYVDKNYDTENVFPLLMNKIKIVDKDIIFKINNSSYKTLLPIFITSLINKNIKLLNDKEIVNFLSTFDNEKTIQLMCTINDYNTLKSIYSSSFIASHLYLVSDLIFVNRDNLLEILNEKFIDVFGFYNISPLLIYYKDDKYIINLIGKKLITGVSLFTEQLHFTDDDLKEFASENFLFFHTLNAIDKEIFLEAESLEIEKYTINFKFQSNEIIFILYNGSIRIQKSDEIYMVDNHQNIIEIKDEYFRKIILKNIKIFLEEKFKYKIPGYLNYDKIFDILKGKK